MLSPAPVYCFLDQTPFGPKGFHFLKLVPRMPPREVLHGELICEIPLFVDLSSGKHDLICVTEYFLMVWT